jgi:hypothetical protein
VDRNTVLWALVLFFGATVMFGLIRNATEDQSVGVSLGAQAAAGLVLIAALVFFLRWRR